MSSAKVRTISATKRLVYSLALLPIVPAASAAGVSCLGLVFGSMPLSGSIDELRWFHFFSAILWVSGTILIWRRMVIWTLGRKWLTALISMIPFAQFAYAKPLWSHTGCWSVIPDSVLQNGQHHLTVAAWIWLCVWVWWGCEKLNMVQVRQTQVGGQRRSGLRTSTLIMASIGTIPFAFGSALVVYVALQDTFGSPWDERLIFAFTAVGVVIAWHLIWRRAVEWSRLIRLLTATFTVGLLAIPICLHSVLLGTGIIDQAGYTAAILSCLVFIGWGVWMAATVYIWPLKAEVQVGDELAPRCLQCGYSLRGLRATRCPECGDEPTLDELWGAANAK